MTAYFWLRAVITGATTKMLGQFLVGYLPNLAHELWPRKYVAFVPADFPLVDSLGYHCFYECN